MLTQLNSIGYRQYVMPFARHAVPLHAMLNSCGYSREESTDYDWHGLTRGSPPFGLLQYTTGGFGMLEHEGKTHPVTAGEAMVLQFPADNRYWLPSHSQKWEFLYVTLHGSELMRIWSDVIGRKGPLLSMGGDSPVVSLLTSIFMDFVHVRLTSPFAASSRAYELGMALLDHVNLPLPSEQRPAYIQDALAFCRDHYREPIGVDHIARAAGCSRYHLSRRFKAWMGTPPAAYVSELRLRESVRLLTHTSLGVKEVARQAGFADHNYFCRLFRQHFGTSPGKYTSSGMY
ncbi:MAG: helix-turn-helix transcriptional regulator [Lentisphaerae bacterium]|nr:helix-turn-helix transcriptional regulator [Lentisphaerota bacterium]